MRLMAVRILEVREAFCSQQFDFEKMMIAAQEGLRNENSMIMRKYLDDTLAAEQEPPNE